jgi:hypothetical protein
MLRHSRACLILRETRGLQAQGQAKDLGRRVTIRLSLRKSPQIPTMSLRVSLPLGLVPFIDPTFTLPSASSAQKITLACCQSPNEPFTPDATTCRSSLTATDLGRCKAQPSRRRYTADTERGSAKKSCWLRSLLLRKMRQESHGKVSTAPRSYSRGRETTPGWAGGAMTLGRAAGSSSQCEPSLWAVPSPPPPLPLLSLLLMRQFSHPRSFL